VIALLHIVPGAVHAAGRPEFGLAFGTAAPLYIGGEGSLGIGSHFTTHVTLGWMPAAYVDLINELSLSQQWYDQATADLIDAALQNSIVLGGQLGWKPYRTHGLEFRAGYTFAALGGSSTSVDVVEAVNGGTLPPQASRPVQIDSQLHLLEVGAGWGWRVAQRAHVTASVSLVECFAAGTQSKIATASRQEDRGAARLESQLNDYLDGIYRNHITAPLVRLMIGSRF